MTDQEYLASLEIQRRNFEAQFGSLEAAGFEDRSKRAVDSGSDEVSDEDSDSDSDSGSDSDGVVSEDGEEEFTGFDDKPEVVRFEDTTRDYVPITRAEKKLLATGKVKRPSSIPTGSKSKSGGGGGRGGDEDEDDLHNDVELQRFLEESHILANYTQSQSGADLTLRSIDQDSVIGNERKKILRSRLQKASLANGARGSTRLEKMPMKMRKGIISSRMHKVAQYEKDARENGIILSKVAKGEMREIGKSSSSGIMKPAADKGKKKSRGHKRDRGLKIQSVGRSTKNGLFISAKEIARVNGTRR